jgi:hypothetical protein
MKKLMYTIGLGLLSGSLWAACMGPYCYDDRGATIGGLVADGNGVANPIKSSTTIAGITPTVAGQLILCNTCVNAGRDKMGVCVSTAANNTSWVLVSSTTVACQ